MPDNTVRTEKASVEVADAETLERARIRMALTEAVYNFGEVFGTAELRNQLELRIKALDKSEQLRRRFEDGV